MRLSEEEYSISGVPKMGTAHNINVLYKRLTPLLVVVITGVIGTRFSFFCSIVLLWLDGRGILVFFY